MERVPSQERTQSREGALRRVYPTQRVPTGRASRSCQLIKCAVIRERVGKRVHSGESDTQQRKVSVSSGNSGSGGCKANAATFWILTLNTIGVAEMRFEE